MPEEFHVGQSSDSIVGRFALDKVTFYVLAFVSHSV